MDNSSERETVESVGLKITLVPKKISPAAAHPPGTRGPGRALPPLLQPRAGPRFHRRQPVLCTDASVSVLFVHLFSS